MKKHIFIGSIIKYILLVLLLFTCSIANSQVSFSKFTFKKDSPFGCCPGRKMTDTKFKITSDKSIKYIRVYYYGINQVGDAVSSDIVGAVNANAKHTKIRILNLTGPYLPNKKYSRWASGSFIYPMKVTAFPFLIELIFMDGEEKSIEITKENYKKFFPCIKEWIDVNVTDGY